MTTQIIPKVFSAASFLIMTNCMRQLPRLMFWCLFPQYLHCQSFNAGLRASCLWPFQVSEPKEKSILHQIEFRRGFFCIICFTWKCVTKIPSEMVVALRYTLLTLFTLFTARSALQCLNNCMQLHAIGMGWWASEQNVGWWMEWSGVDGWIPLRLLWQLEQHVVLTKPGQKHKICAISMWHTTSKRDWQSHVHMFT